MKTEATLNESREFAISRILNLNRAKLGVEIGVFKGKFSKAILDRWPGTLYMVDPWRPLGDEYFDASNHKMHVTAYSDTMEIIKGYEDRRSQIKIALNIILNAETKDKAINAIAKKEKLNINKKTALKIYDKLEERHSSIKQYFGV